MSKKFLRILPVNANGSWTRLVQDFMNEPEDGLGGLVRGYSKRRAFWSEVAAGARGQERPARGEPWLDVIEEVSRLSERAGTAARVLQKLKQAKTVDVTFVVTGQQPGLMGGALLALYKAWTAAAVADRLEKMMARPAVPLFWVAGDDTDFQEIKSMSLLGRDLAQLGVALPAGDFRTGQPVGAVLAESAATAWAGLGQFINKLPGFDTVQAWLPAALAEARDQGESFTRIISKLTQGTLAFVDGRSGAVRRCGRSLMAGYLDREHEVKQAVRQRGDWLTGQGYRAQLSPGEDSGIFLIEGGVRRVVPGTQKAALKKAVKDRVEDCSPGVILRTLVQDEVFRPAAVVLGPAEIAYRVQMAGLFEMFRIPRPAVIPRLSATYLPPVLRDRVGAEPPERIEALLNDPARVVGDWFDSAVPAALREAWDRFQGELQQAIGGLGQTGREELSEKLQSKLIGRLNDIQKRIGQLDKFPREAGREAALHQYPFLANIAEVIKPQGGPQERVLSVLAPMLLSGDRIVDTIEAMSAVYTDELMDGNACHVVYSS